jgi:Opacity protein and related surface antigens
MGVLHSFYVLRLELPVFICVCGLGDVMRRLHYGLLATVAAIGWTSAASAADLPTKAPVQKAPVYDPGFNWTGCYVGGHIGGGWGRKDVSNGEIFPGFNTQFNGFRDDLDGFLGGVQGGCDYQFAQNWVIGIEGQYSWGNLKGDFSTDPFLFGKSPGLGTFTAKTNRLANVTGRIGYAWSRWMVYGKGGFAWAHDTYTLFRTQPVDPFYLSGSESRSGWLVGVGVEYALTDNWSAKLEYNFMDFGSKLVSLPGTFRAQNLAVPPAVTIDQQVHAVKLGVNYRFNWGTTSTRP